MVDIKRGPQSGEGTELDGEQTGAQQGSIEKTPSQSEKVRAEQRAGERTHDSPVFRPRVDIYEAEDGLVLAADLPGVAPDGLDIRLERRVLTIYGRVSTTPPKGFSPVYREYEIGDFERQFTLSGDFNTEAIQADLSDGVLRIRIPKAPELQARRIEVKPS